MVIYLVLTVLRHHSDVLIFTQSHVIINFTFSEYDYRAEDLHDGPNRDEYASDDEEAALPRAREAETQRLRQKEKHPLWPPCSCVAYQCPGKFSDADRQCIYEEIWSNHYQTRRNLAQSLIDKTVGRSMKYHLITSTGERARVCRIMCWATLGYRQSSQFADKIFRTCPPSSAVVPLSQRGK